MWMPLSNNVIFKNRRSPALTHKQSFVGLRPWRGGLLFFDPHQHDTMRGYIRAEAAGKDTQVLFEPQIPNLDRPSDANLREVDAD